MNIRIAVVSIMAMFVIAAGSAQATSLASTADKPNVIAFYQPANFGKKPITYEAKTQVHIGGNRWLYAYRNARLVNVVKNGVAFKQIKTLKGQRILSVHVSYANTSNQASYTSEPWNTGRHLIPIHSSSCLDNRDGTATCSHKRLVFARVEISEPGRPVPASGKGGMTNDG